MSNSNVTKVFKTVQKFASKHSPEILTGLGIAGMCTTVIFAVQATPKAMKLIEEEKQNKQETPDEEVVLTPVETVKVAWKPFVPVIITGAASIACVIGANSVHVRRHAALYSAYKLSETALIEYKDKMEEVVGKKKVKEIKQKIAEDKVEKVTAPDSKTKVIVSDDGDSWFIDPFSNATFRSSKNKIDAAAVKLSRRLLSEMFVSLSDFYDELGLDHTATSDNLGWCVDDSTIEVDYSDAIVKDGKAYIVMDFLVRPEYGYDDKQKYYA